MPSPRVLEVAAKVLGEDAVQVTPNMALRIEAEHNTEEYHHEVPPRGCRNRRATGEYAGYHEGGAMVCA